MHPDSRTGVRERDTGSASSCSAAIQPQYISLGYYSTDLTSLGVFRFERDAAVVVVSSPSDDGQIVSCFLAARKFSPTIAHGNNAARARISLLGRLLASTI